MKKFFKNILNILVFVLISVEMSACAVSTGKYAFVVGVPVRGTLTTAPSYDYCGRPYGGSRMNFETGVPTIESTYRTRRTIYQDVPQGYAGQPVQSSAPADDIDAVR